MTATVKQLEIQIDDIIKHIQDLTQVVMHLQSVVQQLEAKNLVDAGAQRIVVHSYERSDSVSMDLGPSAVGYLIDVRQLSEKDPESFEDDGYGE